MTSARMRQVSAEVANQPLVPIALGGGELRQLRHVCGFFEGPEDADRTLVPFIAEGLEHHQRAVHVVEAAARNTHSDRLAAAGIDVRLAIGTGQLVITTWDEAYPTGGRFDRAAMLRYIGGRLRSGHEDGFEITRLIAYMDWALPEMASGADLVAYDQQLDVALRGVPDVVICVYDVQRHRAGVLVRILNAHPVGIVEGELRNAVGSGSLPRERILQAASELFTSRGIAATGVDTLISAAGVAKATFYRHFPSKDDLVVAWLLDWRTRWFDRVSRKAEESAASPDELIPALFDGAVDWLRAGDFRGCPYLNAAVEIVDPAAPARRAALDYVLEVEAYLRRALETLGHADAAALAAQLQTLLAGGISLSVAHGNTQPLLAARAAAVTMLRNDATANVQS
jgi:AcrR family transcriptional regulator